MGWQKIQIYLSSRRRPGSMSGMDPAFAGMTNQIVTSPSYPSCLRGDYFVLFCLHPSSSPAAITDYVFDGFRCAQPILHFAAVSGASGPENMGVPVAEIRGEAERFPKGRATAAGVDSYDLPGTHRQLKQLGGQSLSNAASPILSSHVESAHSKRAWNDRFERQPTDSGEQSVRIGGKQGLALAIEAYFAGRPIGSERVQHAIAFGVRLRPHGVEAKGQIVGYRLKPEPALLRLLTFHLLP